MADQANISYAQLVTLFEVSRKINSQLNFQKLLDEIMDLAIELLKAEKGLLLLKQLDDKELAVQVARQADKHTIDEVVALSRTVIKKVEGEGAPLLLQRVPELRGLDANASLMRHKIKSVVCVPLKARDKLIGAIYLDTTNADHFFQKEDIPFLEAFANLAGIAIENARSYREIDNLNTNLEALVEQRTKEVRDKHAELQEAYDRLKTTQLQLLRSEKMASLGMLVAGVAHEINTPLGAISSGIDTFIRGFKKIREHLVSIPGMEPVTEKLDILENLASVNETACSRITSIVKTLRNFARLDEGEFKKVNLHDGIDSTLTLTAHLSSNRITVIKDYGELPQLECHANQINQVFMNILVNACQAIEGTGTITIKTFLKDEHIHVAIADTGVGIPKDNISKIFDPGFTTKGVGVGTGLGLSISYRVVEEHGGKIMVDSEVGKGTTFTVVLPLEHPTGH